MKSTQNPRSPLMSSGGTASTFGILLGLSLSHFLNDSIQALIPAVYPLLKRSFGLSFTHIGLITLTFQMTGSVFQPLVGFYTDRNPKPYSQAAGMAITLGGLVLLALARGYGCILLAAGMIGLGSAIFHPESSRMARLASGGRHGLAQSLFQVGGNAGTAAGPLLAAWIVVPRGQSSILFFTLIALAGIFVLSRLGSWYAALLAERRCNPHATLLPSPRLSRGTLVLSLGVLLALMFSKFFYLASMTNYYTFYLMEKFHLSIQGSQYRLFTFLISGAAGTVVGGLLGDKFGRKTVIWFSILGMAPFGLALPHANLLWTTVLSIMIGFIMSSAFPAILVYATELLPGNVGLVAGLFFGLAFGLAGIGSAMLGRLADATSVPFVISVCSFLPLIGLLTGLLPELPSAHHAREEKSPSAGHGVPVPPRTPSAVPFRD
jgi:MFS transporter, FSR family, fosmidomycin resistance protein